MTGSSLGNYVGGLVAMNKGSIENCVVSGTIEPFATDCIVGGIASENSGTIANCVNLANIFVRDSSNSGYNVNVGGIVNRNLQNGLVENCVNFGNLGHGTSKDRAASGICSRNQGEIIGCYAFGNFSYPIKSKMEFDDYSGQEIYFDGIRYGICKENAGTIKQSYACGQDIDELIGTGGYNSMDGKTIDCSYIALKDAYNKTSYPGFDFQNVWTTNQLGLPYPVENVIFSSLNLDFSHLKTEISNVCAQPNSYKSIAITWDKNEACAKYHLYLLTEQKDSYTYGTIPSHEDKSLYKILAVIDGEQNRYIHQVSANDQMKYAYALAPVWDVGGVLIEGVCSPITSSYVVDTNGIKETPEDTVAPVIENLSLLTEETYPPGEVKIRLNAKDNSSGIATVQLEFATENKDQFFTLEQTFAEKTMLEGDFSFSVDSNTPYGNYTLRYIKISDKEGNEHRYTGAYFDSPELSVSKEFDIEFTGVLSSKYIANEVTNMEDGKTVVLTIDEKSNGILKKEILDAIKGKDKTVVVYADAKGSMQWVFYGIDIKGETKDLDLNTSVETVKGDILGLKSDVLELVYADNGSLPGKVNFRLKSDYLGSIYNVSSELFLYYKNGKNVELESSSCIAIKDGSAYWCYIDLSHNSTFYLTGEKTKSTVVVEPHKCVFKETKIKATLKEDGKITKKCTCGKTKTTKISKISTVKLSKTSYVFDGKVKNPTLIIEDSKKKALKEDKDYTVSISKGRKNVGKYTYKITFKGNYKGTKSLTFQIVPKATSLTSATGAKKAFTVKWKKQPSQTTGYEVCYSTSSKFTKATTKYVKVTKNKTTSKKISNLKAKKKYYVKVRTYKKVDGKYYYSAWSKYKSVTTKK